MIGQPKAHDGRVNSPSIYDNNFFVREVKLRWPGLPVILTSGLPRELVGELPLGVDYMLKPWQPLNLLVAAKQALAARHG